MRVEDRVKSWHDKFLSQAGKEVLIKFVLLALPTYAMSVFKLPSKLCKEVSQLIARFWWGHMTNQKKVH